MREKYCLLFAVSVVFVGLVGFFSWVLWGSNKHGFVCLFYYWTLVCWGHDEADDILCFVALGKDSGCHRLAAKQFVGTAALEYDIMCFQITSEFGQREKKPEGLTTKRGFACCQVAEGLWPRYKWDCGFFFPVVQKHLKRGFHLQFKVHFGTGSRTGSITLSVLT